MSFNPFLNERRILLFAIALSAGSAAMSLGFPRSDQFDRQYHPFLYQIRLFAMTPLGIFLSILLIGCLLLLWRRASLDQDHWLRKINVFGIPGHLYVFGMAMGGAFGMAMSLILRAIS